MIRIKNIMVNLDNVVSINYSERDSSLYVVGTRDPVSAIIKVDGMEEVEKIFKLLEKEVK